MLRKMLWKTFTLGDLCFPIHFLRFFPKLDKPQLVPFSLVHFFFGMLNQIRKVSAGCTIGTPGGGKGMPNAAESNSQLAENYTKPKWELEGGKAKEKHTNATSKVHFHAKSFLWKSLGVNFWTLSRWGGGGGESWRSYAKHRRLLLQNAAVRVIFWHGAHAAGLKNVNSNPNSHLDSHSHSDWDSNCPRKPPTPSWTFQ